MLVAIILLPLLIGMAVMPFVRQGLEKYLAIGASLLALLLLPFGTGGSIKWFGFGNVEISIAVSTQAINRLLLYLVGAVMPIVLFYSFGYMSLPSEQKRYYLEMLGFESAMLLFAMSSSFITLFIGWEILSLFSYLLIGFWYSKEKVVVAARKAISIVLLGDIALFASMVLFFVASGSFDFSAIASLAPSPVLMLAASLFILAAFVKSAQFPFHEWLPEAMEGPAPVSASLHSTTMVKAGVFAVLLLYPLVVKLNLEWILLYFGLLTAVIATLDALRERHIKRVLAYSTVQELSLMFVAIGANAFLAAVYFFFAQSFYKALLFFIAGSAMKATGKEDLYEVSDLPSNRCLFVSAAFGVLSLAGFIPFDGFFSSASIGYALSTNLIAYAILLVIGILTSLFIFRWFSLSSRSRNASYKIMYEGMPRSMSYSSAVLAALCLFAGLAFIYLPKWLAAYPVSKPLAFTGIDASLAMIVSSVGMIIGIRMYRNADAEPIKHNFQSTRLFNIFYYLLAMFFYLFAEGLFYVEYYIDDLFYQFGHAIILLGNGIRRVAAGSLNIYALAFVIGIILLVLVVV